MNLSSLPVSPLKDEPKHINIKSKEMEIELGKTNRKCDRDNINREKYLYIDVEIEKKCQDV